MDTTEAGDGEVVVDVTYDGRQMATRIDRKGQLHHISFMPEGPGVYNIEVQFQDREVTGLHVLQDFSVLTIYLIYRRLQSIFKDLTTLKRVAILLLKYLTLNRLIGANSLACCITWYCL